MMKMIALSFFIGAAALLQGCTYPNPAQIQQTESRPAIGISGAPEGAHLFVDGLDMGAAAQFDGKAGVLLVESGKHQVELKDAGGNVLYSEELFLSSSTTKIITYTP